MNAVSFGARDPLARSGERPVHRVVLHAWVHGDQKLRVRRALCTACRCGLARDERRCRRCFVARDEARRVHLRAPAAWLDDFGALRLRAAQSNWPPHEATRRSRAREGPPREVTRVTLSLTTAEELYALEKLQTWPIRRGLDRWEWISSAWIELMSPPTDTDAEGEIDGMIQRAIWRAEKSLRAEK